MLQFYIGVIQLKKPNFILNKQFGIIGAEVFWKFNWIPPENIQKNLPTVEELENELKDFE